jgi:hypothetical protein
MAILVNALFNGTAGTNLTAYTPDTGGAFAKATNHAANLQLNGSGDAVLATNGIAIGCYLNATASASADESAIGYIRREASGSAFAEIGVVARCSDDGDTHYRAWTNGTSFRLSKRVGGTDTELGTYTVTFFGGQVYALKVECVGSAIKVYTQRVGTDGDFIERISVVDTDVAAAGKGGLWTRNTGGAFTAPGLFAFQEFRFEGTESGGGGSTHHHRVANGLLSMRPMRLTRAFR